ALNNVEKTKTELENTIKETKIAYDNLNLVKKEYKENNLNYTALQDARKDYIDTSIKYVSNLYDYNMALIQTEMALHYHIVDIHHKSQHAMHHHADELIEHLNDVLDCDEKENKSKKKKKIKSL
ncbi:hypothetical protein IJ531_05880, partial [bacterium]|nr:hypothetical protein [bacterium]